MPRDSQGNFTNLYNWVEDAANQIGIEADRHQGGDDDQATGLTDSLDRKGRGGMQADLAMGNNKLTQLNEGTAAADGAPISQLQVGAFTLSATETGTANDYKVALTPAITAYTSGLIVRFTATNANTGASTLEVNSVVPAPALQWQGKDLVADTIAAGALVVCQYDGTAFQIINVPEVLPEAYGGTGRAFVAGATSYGAYDTYSSHTTVIPIDDTIPQSTEGDEILTVAITPKSASSKLRVQVTSPIMVMSDAAQVGTMALFRDAGADALASVGTQAPGANTVVNMPDIDIEVDATAATETTFKVRVGPATGTLYVNGNQATRLYGGTSRLTMTVDEILA